MPDKSDMLSAGPASSAGRVVWHVSRQGQALLAVLFPHLAGLSVHRVGHFSPRALREPCVTISRYTALVVLVTRRQGSR